MDINQRKIDSLLESTKNQIYRENFYEFFVNVAFPALHPNRLLKYAKSTEILCAIGQAFSLRKNGFRQVIVNIPPGLMKSEILSVALTAWHLGRNSGELIYGVSNVYDLSSNFVQQASKIIKSQKYNKVFPNVILDKDTQGGFTLPTGGGRFAFSTFGNITGRRCQVLIADDYMSGSMFFSDAEIKKATESWDKVFESRVSEGDSDENSNGNEESPPPSILIVEQRLDIRDLTGFLTRTRPEEYTVFALPAIFEKKTEIIVDNKKFIFEEDEILSPRIGKEKIKKLKNRLVDPETGIANAKQVFFAQYMQNPVADGGNMVDINWFQPFNISDSSSMKFDRVVVSVDSAQKPNEVNDPSAFLKFGMIGKSKYLIDQYCERKVYPETKESLIAFCNNGHRATDLIIEDANTGSSLIQELPNEQKLYGISITPISHGGIKKEIRFYTAAAALSNGTYFFPKDATWYPSFESELMQFPKGRHDDRCDCLSQFAHWEVKQSLMFNFWCESI